MTGVAWGTAQEWAVVLGLVVCSVVCRSFFFLGRKPWTLPDWLERGLKYAPLAALAAVIAPDILLTQGSWSFAGQGLDPRWISALCATGWAVWRGDMLETIAVGMLVFLGFRGWVGV